MFKTSPLQRGVFVFTTPFCYTKVRIMTKNFDEWNNYKKKLDELTVPSPKAKEGEIWWVSFGINIGSEIFGKGERYTRPALILKRMNGGKSFLVAPTTKTRKDNFLYYKVNFDTKQNIESYICLNQIRIISKERVREFYGDACFSLQKDDFEEVKNRIKNYYLSDKNSARPLVAGEEGVDTAPHIAGSLSDRKKLSIEERRKKNIIILVGRSGSGKGTQGELIKQYMENCGQDDMCLNTVYYISTGQRFREFVARDTYTSAISRKVNEIGGLQPEFLAVWNWSSILIDYIQDEGNIIFDGAPRKLHEAEVLDSAINFYGWHKPLVLEIDVDLEECVKRMLLRKRADDTEQVIRERLSWYDRDVVPMLEWYKNNPSYTYKKINGNRTVDEIWSDIKNVLEEVL